MWNDNLTLLGSGSPGLGVFGNSVVTLAVIG